MKTLIERAEEYAVKMHGDQRYGEHPYKHHLQEVTGSLCVYDKSDYKVEHVAVGWLHDVLEDTEATDDDLVELFGNSISDAVEALTFKFEPFHEYLAKIRGNRTATVVKMHDRLVNMTNSIGHARLTMKYVSQYGEFKAALYCEQYNPMWERLDKAYTNLIKNGDEDV